MKGRKISFDDPDTSLNCVTGLCTFEASYLEFLSAISVYVQFVSELYSKLCGHFFEANNKVSLR